MLNVHQNGHFGAFPTKINTDYLRFIWQYIRYIGLFGILYKVPIHIFGYDIEHVSIYIYSYSNNKNILVGKIKKIKSICDMFK